MDVQCEKCGTEYELEDARVTPKGVKVKCTQCGHLFRVVRQPSIPPLNLPGAKQGKISVSSKSSDNLKVAAPPGRAASGTAKLGTVDADAKALAGVAVADTIAAPAAAKASAKPSVRSPTTKTLSGTPSAPAPSPAVTPGPPPRAAKTPVTATGPTGGGEPAKAAAPVPQAAKKAETKRWYIRKPSGEIFQFKELTTLQQWIVEEKVDREDEISRTGRTWERLGVIEELSPFFSVVDQARHARQAESDALQESGSGRQAAPRPLEPEMAKRPQQDEFVDEDAPTGRRGEGPHAAATAAAATAAAAASGPVELGGGAVPASDGHHEPSELGDLSGGAANGTSAAWENDGLRVASGAREVTAEVPLDEDELAVRRPGAVVARYAAVLIVGGLVGLAAFVVWYKWEKIVDMLSGDRDRTADYFSRGRAYLRKDTSAAFKKALEQFKLVLGAKGSPEARASRAELLSLWSLYHAEEVARLEKKAAALEKRGAGGSAVGRPPTAEYVKINKQLGVLRQRAHSLAIRAYHDAQMALKKKSTALTHRAQALALLALNKPLKKVQLHLEKSLGFSGNDPETLYAKALFLIRQNQWEKARQVLGQAITINRQQSSKILYRAHYLLATVLARKGDVGGARAELQTILGTNAGHLRAKAFLARLSAGVPERPRPPTVVSLTPGPDAGTRTVVPRDTGEKPRTRPGDPGDGQPTGDYYSLVRKGDRFSENGRLSDALKAYQKALTLRSNGVEALIGLAYCYLDRRQRGRALSTFRRALRARPGYGEAIIGMAQTYKRMGRLSQALTWYKKYLSAHPSGRKSGLARRNVQELGEKVKAATPRPPDTRPPDTGPTPRPPVVIPPTRPPDTRPAPRPRPPGMAAPRPAPRPAGMTPPRPAPRPAAMGARPSGG